jgi:hypothetical protein
MTPGFTGPFKGDPQQGTLFDKRALDYLPGNTNLTRKRPGPRGYSPERLAEVRGAFETANASGPNSGPMFKPVEVGGPAAPTNRLNETAHQFGPSSYNPENPHYGRARSRIVDTLSRSTINVSDELENPLAGLGRIETRPAGYGSTFAGTYQSHGGYDQPDEKGFRRAQGPTVTLYSHGGSQKALWGQDEEAEQTLLHEIGHHESYTAGSESSAYETNKQQAVEEARADTFAVKHFRRDPRNKGEYDPRQHTYMARGQHDFGGNKAFYERTMPASMQPPVKRNLGPQFHQPELDETQPLGRLHQRERGTGPWPDVFIGKDIEKPQLRMPSWPH